MNLTFSFHAAPTSRRRNLAGYGIILTGTFLSVLWGQTFIFPSVTRVTMTEDYAAGPVAEGLQRFKEEGSKLRQVKSKTQPPPPPTTPQDGSFNGAPLTLKRGELVSRVHCVGENYQAGAWKQRSCKFSNLCFNTTAKEFVIFESPQEQELMRAVSARPFIDVSSALSKDNLKVSVGGINLKVCLVKIVNF